MYGQLTKKNCLVLPHFLREKISVFMSCITTLHLKMKKKEVNR